MLLRASLSLPSISRTRTRVQPSSSTLLPNPKFSLGTSNSCRPLHASRRIRNFPQGSCEFVDDPRSWSRPITPDYYGGDDEDDDPDGEDEDRSLDLLIRFVQNVFRKVSKRARKAVRSVLPLSIPSNLVGFSVNGVLLLAFLWILKAFLEVVCTLGSVVFVSILVIRGVWMGITYLQESRNQTINGHDDDRHVWSSAQPAS